RIADARAGREIVAGGIGIRGPNISGRVRVGAATGVDADRSETRRRRWRRCSAGRDFDSAEGRIVGNRDRGYRDLAAGHVDRVAAVNGYIGTARRRTRIE